MSVPPQFSLNVPQPPKQAKVLQFKQPRKYFGEESKQEMKKSSIFFSNPTSEHPTFIGSQPNNVNTQQGSIRLEFKKKNTILGSTNTNQTRPLPTTAETKLTETQAQGTVLNKPMMYSSQIVKPTTTEYKFAGLDTMGRFVGPSQDQNLGNRFGAQKPGLNKAQNIYETKKPTQIHNAFQLAGNIYGEQKKTNTYDNKYSEFNSSSQSYSNSLSSQPRPYVSQTIDKTPFTPNYAPEYSANLGSENAYSDKKYDKPDYLPTYQNKGGSGFKSTEFPIFNSLSNEFLKPSKTENFSISNTSNTNNSTNYGSYQDNKYYLDTAKNKVQSSYGSNNFSSLQGYSTSAASQPGVFSKKTNVYETKPYEESNSTSSYGTSGIGQSYSASTKVPINEVQLSCKAKKTDFQIGKKLGKGQFGDVFVVKHKLTGFICAMKIIKKSTIKEEKVEEQLVRELKIQFYLHNKNIVALYGFFQDTESVYLLLQLCCEGQLFDIIKKERRLSEERTSDIVRQVCLGIEAIHREKIIHRDIKPQNVILHEGVAKICDFGWAVYRGDGLRTTFCGTPMYTSPQMLRGEKYDEKIDIWAIGILTYELLIGRIPFRMMCEDDMQRILTDQITFPDYVDVTSTAKDFILKVLKRNQSEQYDIQDIINHPFLREKKKPEEFSMINL